MRYRTVTLLGFACLILALKGDSCLIEKRTVDTVVTGDIPETWTTQGTNSSGTSTSTAASRPRSIGAYVGDALDKLSSKSHVESIHIAGACYEVLQNRGFVGSHAGDVSVDGHPLLTFSAPSNATGVTGGSAGAEVTLVKDGTDYLNGLLNQFVTQYNEGNHSPTVLDNLTFTAHWTSAAPTPPAEYDFDWKTCLILQIVGTVTLDVPNP